jgi:hypothetical protein
MLRKVLGAFKISPIAAIKVEASILSIEIRFEKYTKTTPIEPSY